MSDSSAIVSRGNSAPETRVIEKSNCLRDGLLLLSGSTQFPLRHSRFPPRTNLSVEVHPVSHSAPPSNEGDPCDALGASPIRMGQIRL